MLPVIYVCDRLCASVSFHLMMRLTAPSQNCLIDCSASFLTRPHNAMGTFLIHFPCKELCSKDVSHCHKEILLSALLLWLSWVAVLLRCTPACLFSAAFHLTWAHLLMFFLVMFHQMLWKFIFSNLVWDFIGSIALCMQLHLLPEDRSIVYTPLECVSIGNHGCLTSSIMLCVPEEFAVIKLHGKTLKNLNNRKKIGNFI